MFKVCRFYFDRDGSLLPEVRELTAKDARGKSFFLESTTTYHAPAVMVCRTRPDKPADDPYDDGTGPPECWVQFVYPHVEFIGTGVILTGLELPNMTWAGLARKEFRDAAVKLDLPPERIWDPDALDRPYGLDNLKRQKILLTVDETRRYDPKKLKT